jgi:uncharacterized lipoprotein YmbA
MARYFVIIAALVLVGCASPQPFVAGALTDGPQAWVEFCDRHPQDRACERK